MRPAPSYYEAGHVINISLAKLFLAAARNSFCIHLMVRYIMIDLVIHRTCPVNNQVDHYYRTIR